jgi:hypothetical protein
LDVIAAGPAGGIEVRLHLAKAIDGCRSVSFMALSFWTASASNFETDRVARDGIEGITPAARDSLQPARITAGSQPAGFSIWTGGHRRRCCHRPTNRLLELFVARVTVRQRILHCEGD